jgi:hypothetical protein
MSEKLIVLFTKKFPYGHQETYLFDELKVLSKQMVHIVLVPYDEYAYLDSRRTDCLPTPILKYSKSINHQK